MATRVQPPQIEVPPEQPQDDGHELRMSLLEHLEELRNRAFKSVLALGVGLAIGTMLATQTLEFLKAPYGPDRFTAIGPTDSMMNYFRVAFMVGMIIAIPVIIYQLLMFILPGLTSKERRVVLTALPVTTLLFVTGVAFAWYFLVPGAIDFLAHFQSQLFQNFWTADRYLELVTGMMLWMGVSFETPLIFFIIALFGMITPTPLVKNWRIGVVGTSIIAAVFSPTWDPFNMFLWMIPLLVMYFVSIFAVYLGNRIGGHRNKPEAV